MFTRFDTIHEYDRHPDGQADIARRHSIALKKWEKATRLWRVQHIQRAGQCAPAARAVLIIHCSPSKGDRKLFSITFANRDRFR